MIDVYTSKNDAKALPPQISCVCTVVKKLSRKLGRAYDAALAPSGLNVTQFAVLRAIARKPDKPLARVAAALAMDRTSFYRAVVPLERHGWVRLGKGMDARSRTVDLTEQGRKVVADALPAWERVQSQIVDEFGGKRWKEFSREIKRLGQCVGKTAEE